MAVIYFGGCSITQGAGFEQEKSDPRIFPNLCTSEAINDAGGGSSNLKIFTHASNAIINENADAYVIQWSALHRHWLYPAPDKGVYIGSDFEPSATSFVAQFQLQNHDYGNILQLVNYTRVLTDLCKSRQAPVVFLNGLVEWSNDLDWMYELVADADSDHDRFVENLQNNLELVEWDRWVDPWHCINKTKIDLAPLDDHPGPQTHKLIAEKINERLFT